jgi:hypothetical protein
MRQAEVRPIGHENVIGSFERAKLLGGGLFQDNDGRIRMYIECGIKTGIYDDPSGHQFLYFPLWKESK